MNIFLQFPVEFDEDKKIISSFVDIMKLSNELKFNIFYSAENLKNLNEVNAEAEIYLTSDLAILRQFIFSSRATNINFIPNEIQYIKWNLDKFSTEYADNLLAHLATKLYGNTNFEYLLVNLEYSIESCRNKLLIFRDCKHLDYPDHFIKIDFVTNFIEFKEWVKTNHITKFSIRDEKFFQKRPEIIVKGAIVYYEIQSKRYWHLDTFHEYIEYEVYNDQGIHIGTSDENGIFKENAKTGRKIEI